MTTNTKMFSIVCLWILGLSTLHAAEISNQLKNHPSPYLALHGTDPVKWQDWGPEVFSRAKKENKLVYVSIGYFSCHWCHVMQKESYKNKKIAAYLNKHYIPVKVDRELHPALDAKLLSFIKALKGHSGWPANVFITPDGYPLLGLVYEKPMAFYARIVDLDSKWKSKGATLRKLAIRYTKLFNANSTQSKPDEKRISAAEVLPMLVKLTMPSADDMSGGFGQSNKFPNFPQLRALMDALEYQANPKLEAFLRLTLDRMASQGLRDHVRGGFFRYTVDTQWQKPHFEKMLYDNAQLAILYMRAARQFKNPQYEAVARDALDMILTEMRDKSGAMYSSLSALDGKGVEGGYYLWSKKQLKKILTSKEYTVVKQLWNIGDSPTFKHGFLPVQAVGIADVAKKLAIGTTEINKRMSSVKTKLRLAQKQRKLPVDTKILAGWNGIALKAFSLGGQLKDATKYKRAAREIRNYIVDELWNGARLLRAKARGGKIGAASLQDYGHIADGLVTWAKLYNRKDFKISGAIINKGWRNFYSRDGWKLSEKKLIALGVGEAIISDSAIASPSATLIRATLEQGKQTQNKAMTIKAHTALYVAQDTLREEPYWFASHISAIYQAEKKD